MDPGIASTVIVSTDSVPVFVVTINRPERKNAVDQATAHALYDAFLTFERDSRFSVAILTGAGGTFCAGADLKSMLVDGRQDRRGGNPLHKDMDKIGPMGCSRLQLSKPVIAAVSGYAVAGGLELACWCDLRVVDDSAVFGVYCRMRGVPLIDGGTVRLPRLIGLSAASDMILTGRAVKAKEAHRLSLANYIADGEGQSTEGQTPAFKKAMEIAQLIASHPQTCMRNDRLSMLKTSYFPTELELMKTEFLQGTITLEGQDFGRAVESFLAKPHL